MKPTIRFSDTLDYMFFRIPYSGGAEKANELIDSFFLNNPVYEDSLVFGLEKNKILQGDNHLIARIDYLNRGMSFYELNQLAKHFNNNFSYRFTPDNILKLDKTKDFDETRDAAIFAYRQHLIS